MRRFLTHRRAHFILLFVLLSAAVLHSGSNARWRVEMQSLVFDELNRFYPREPSNRVLIVNIDDDSLEKLGQWPWPRTILADLIMRLNALGARAIVFDGVLAEPDRSSPRLIAQTLAENDHFTDFADRLETLPDHDEILARAIEKAGNFVTAFSWGSYSHKASHAKPRIMQPILAKKAEKAEFISHTTSFKSTANFLPALEKAAAGNGSFMALPDRDGVLRRAGLVFTDGRELYPSLSLEAVRVAGGKPWRSVRIAPAGSSRDVGTIDTAYRLDFDDYRIPVEDDGLLYVYYRIFDERGEDYLSAHKILDDSFQAQVEPLVRDRVILIGSSAEGLKDLRSTALEPFQPGVEIHANVIEQILQGRYLLRPEITKGAEAVFIFTAGLAMIALAPFISVAVLLLLCATLVGGAFAGSAAAYVDHGLLLDPFYPSLCVIVIFVASVLLTYLRVESERRQVRDAFGLYISRDFMRELTKNPERLKLGGEIRELTVLFSDIRSFTSISEGLTPEELIQLMNDFLTPMSDLVMQNRGTIDKYMGDAMMAFWNAPLDDADHALHACRAALGMQAALEPVNEEVRRKAQEAGREPVLLNAGIGLNTGPCAVGNMGSRQRFAYSTLGDAVNLASRLEGQTKTYGVGILIGESTRRAASGLAALEMDLIRVKGKEEAVRIFALLGDEETAQSPAFKALQAEHEAMIAAYRARDFEGASARLAQCRAQAAPYGLETVYGLYETRIKDLLANPPDEGWDGVFTATSK